MRNGSDGPRRAKATPASESNGRAGTPIEIPEDLKPDREGFQAQVSPQVERGIIQPAALDLLDRYALLLYSWIPRLTLIAKGDRTTLYTRHILDSLNPIGLFACHPERIIDIGSGGGLPGIPLAIVWPGSNVALLESREKKAAFLERAARELGLRNVRVECERLEEHARKHGPTYDAVFVRAVADLPGLLEEIAPSCRPGARWVYFMGGGTDRESLRANLERTGRIGTEVLGSFGGHLLTGDV